MPSASSLENAERTSRFSRQVEDENQSTVCSSSECESGPQSTGCWLHHDDQCNCTAACTSFAATVPSGGGGNLTMPPRKRHCRSLSIPGDGVNAECCLTGSGIGGGVGGHHRCSGRSWQPQVSGIWKPVPVRLHAGGCSSAGGKLLQKGVGSTLNSHNKVRVPSAAAAASVVNQLLFQPFLLHDGGQSAALVPSQQLTSHYQQPGAALSCPLVVGGSSLSTPSESPSPVPRPASASSGFFDSSEGSLNMSWPDGGGGGIRHSSGGSGASSSVASKAKFSAFNSCSMSLAEKKMSDVVSGCDLSRNSTLSLTSGSMPTIPRGTGSTPSSPSYQRPQRCRSQPSVFGGDRKFGKKRRREDERPKLDFVKMTEVWQSTIYSCLFFM